MNTDLPRLDDEYYLPILEGVAQVLREAEVRLVHIATSDTTDTFNTVTDHSTDRIVLFLPSDEAIEHLERSGLPFVLIHNQGGWRFRNTLGDHYQLGGRLCRDLTSDQPWAPAYRLYWQDRSGERRLGVSPGYRAALDAANLPLDPQLQCAGNFTEADGYTATRALLELPDHRRRSSQATIVRPQASIKRSTNWA